jgi:hypothetical protein
VRSVDPNLPGAEIVEQALQDLDRHVESCAALALQVILPRLRLVDYPVPKLELDEAAELMLYQHLCEEGVPDPYSSYNAMLRRLYSFAAAVEAEYYRKRR